MPSVLPLWGAVLAEVSHYLVSCHSSVFLFWAAKMSVIRALPSVVFPVCRDAQIIVSGASYGLCVPSLAIRTELSEMPRAMI